MSRVLLSLPAAVVFFLLCHAAPAQVWVDANQLDGKLPDWADPKYVEPGPTPRLPPSVEYRRVWVEPVYRIVCRRVWIEPVVRWEYDRVWIPPRYEWRDIVMWEDGVKVIRQERVCVEPGHYELQRREVVVTPGHWEMREFRELVTPGYWKLVPV
jgi:hypothetical protein